MRRKSLAIYLAITGLAVYTLRVQSLNLAERQEKSDAQKAASIETSTKTRAPASLGASNESGPKLGANTLQAKAALPSPAKVSNTPSLSVLDSAEKARLAEYAQIKAKVFTTELEKTRRQTLYGDTVFLKKLGQVVSTPTSATNDEKNAAVDLLIEAASQGHSDLANALIKDVVADKTIEDSSMAMDVREDLAGLKAELIYRWVADQPARASDVASAIPGPVTSQIWKNVQAQHEQNRLESTTLATKAE